MKEKKLKFNKVVSFLSKNQLRSAISEVNLWNDELLAEFNLHYPNIHEEFRAPEFHEFWQKWLAKLRIPSNAGFRFQSNQGLMMPILLSVIYYFFMN
ncbi:hypothetical protein EP47_13655 [Legionella norrlandica]|uniref:Uncharacterized protein n=1 Tax=Legionella norrlandica TaxID=1498499 RepID=A0A0A2SNK4_9GAMM|nr:hypothetical protein EP47_13655 [Legionella norrlandica]